MFARTWSDGCTSSPGRPPSTRKASRTTMLKSKFVVGPHTITHFWSPHAYVLCSFVTQCWRFLTWVCAAEPKRLFLLLGLLRWWPGQSQPWYWWCKSIILPPTYTIYYYSTPPVLAEVDRCEQSFFGIILFIIRFLSGDKPRSCLCTSCFRSCIGPALLDLYLWRKYSTVQF